MTVQYRQPPTYEQPLQVGTHTSSAWYRYIQLYEQGVPPAAETVLKLTGSPFTYTAPRAGFVIVNGGTVGMISFSRSGTFYNTGRTVGFFTLAQGDRLKITYSAAPTAVWVPL